MALTKFAIDYVFIVFPPRTPMNFERQNHFWFSNFYRATRHFECTQPFFHSWCWRLNLVSALHMLNKWSSPELAPPVKKNTSFENYSKFHRLVLSFLCSLRKPWIHCFLPTIFTKLGWQSCTNQAQLCLFIHKGMDRTVKNFLLAYLNLHNVPEKHDYFLFLSLYSILCAETTTGL